MDLFFTWLQRSNRSLLNYSLRCDLEDVEGAQPHLTAEYMIKRLMFHQGRWENIDLDCSILVSFDFPGVKLHRMTRIKSLKLNFMFENYKGEILDAYINVANSPRLEELRLSGSYVLEVGKRPIRHLSGITDLQFYGEHADGSIKRQCLNLLKASPKLYLFRGSFSHIGANVVWKPPPNENDEPITHELRYLVLENGSPSPDIIDKLTLPFLRSLYYGGYDTVGEGDILLKFIQRSLPPLTYLFISTFELEEDKLLTVLRCLPALRDLSLKYMALTTRFFRELTPQIICFETEAPASGEGNPGRDEGSSAPGENPPSPPVTEDASEVPSSPSTEDTEEAAERLSVPNDVSEALESAVIEEEVAEEPKRSPSEELEHEDDLEETSTSVQETLAATGLPPPDELPELPESPPASEAEDAESVTTPEAEPRETELQYIILPTLCPELKALELDWLYLREDTVTVVKSVCDMFNTRSSLYGSFQGLLFDDREGFELPYAFNEEEYEHLANILENKKWVKAYGYDDEWVRML